MSQPSSRAELLAFVWSWRRCWAVESRTSGRPEVWKACWNDWVGHTAAVGVDRPQYRPREVTREGQEKAGWAEVWWWTARELASRLSDVVSVQSSLAIVQGRSGYSFGFECLAYRTSPGPGAGDGRDELWRSWLVVRPSSLLPSS